MKKKGLIKFIITVTAVALVIFIISKLNYGSENKSNISIKERKNSYIAEEDTNNDGVRVDGEVSVEGGEKGSSIKVLPVPDISKEVIINQL